MMINFIPLLIVSLENDSGWNKIPEKGYEGQVMLLHPNSFDNSILGAYMLSSF